MTTPSDVRSFPLPITRVVCLEDRAQVERAGTLTLSSGLQRLRLEKVSPLLVERSLKVELSGATLVDARVVRRWKEKPPGGLPVDASALRRREAALEEERDLVHADRLRAEAKAEVLRAAQADVLRAIAERSATGDANSAVWKEQLSTVRARITEQEERVRDLGIHYRHVEDERQAVSAARVASERKESELEVWVELTVEATEALEARLRIRYLVPNALWRPAYRATLDEAGGPARLALESFGTVWQRTGEDWTDVELAFSTARPTLGAAPPVLLEDRLALREKSDLERRVVDVSLREEDVESAGEGVAARASELPGLDDGGEVRLLRPSAKVRVPSDGQPHRVALGRFEAAATVELLCAPELSPLASRVATFVNEGKDVLLAGPVELVRQGGFVGRAQLKFAGVGERVRVSFGSEDGLRVVRTLQEVRDENRLTGRRTVKRGVKLFVSNASGTPAQFTLLERVLVSEVKEVDVTFLAKEARPAPEGPDADGLLRFAVSVGAREHRELSYAYEVSAAGKVAGV